jgi:hypothetical protein
MEKQKTEICTKKYSGWNVGFSRTGTFMVGKESLGECKDSRTQETEKG